MTGGGGGSPLNKYFQESSPNFPTINRLRFKLMLFSFVFNVYAFVLRRDLYYQDTQVFGSQTCVDAIVDNISCMLRVPRACLHIVSILCVVELYDAGSFHHNQGCQFSDFSLISDFFRKEETGIKLKKYGQKMDGISIVSTDMLDSGKGLDNPSLKTVLVSIY